ncbi:MAG TPA: DNA-protecting protein DprA, partial [Phenylobacterium sp.]|nr:DNA-protecting protein DprA [Phenylobacterium sp.]
GTNDLIRQGAQMCESAEDVLRALSGLPDVREKERDLFDDAPLESAATDLEALRERLAGLLSPTPVSRDELIRATGAPPSAVLAALVELALAGRAELLAGGLVARG